MNTDQILKEILTKRVDVTKLHDDSLLTDLGLDSLDLVEMVIEIEDTLDVKFDNEEILKLKSVRDMKNLIAQKSGK